MKKRRIIHLRQPGTLSDYIPVSEREKIEELRISGVIGRKDFNDVLDRMCNVMVDYEDEDDDIGTPNYDYASDLRLLDLGDAVYTDGVALPYFGDRAQLEVFVLPQGIETTIEEEEPVTGLWGSERLRSLYFPEGLKTVGGFGNCPYLTSLVLPEGLEEILPFAFAECKSITSIRIPQTVLFLDGSSFAGCNISKYEVDSESPFFTELDGVVYNKEMTTLVAFPSNYPHKYFKIPDSVNKIGENAFMNSNVENVELHSELVQIGGTAFQGSKIRSISIPESVQKMDRTALRFCDFLETVSLPYRFHKCLRDIRHLKNWKLL